MASDPPPFSSFDTRGYPTLSAREGYDRWAASYEETVSDAMDVALLTRLDVDWPAARSVADLGCGTGRTGRWLRDRGVGEIDGVDVSAAMLAGARAHSVYRSLSEADVSATDLDAAAYDLVVSCLVDEHLADLAPLYSEAARLLGDAGDLVIVGIHPHFLMAAGMPTHFDDAETGAPIAIETNVHLMSQHVAAAQAAGFALRQLCERTIDEEWLALKPGWEPHRDHPISFAWVWTRR